MDVRFRRRLADIVGWLESGGLRRILLVVCLQRSFLLGLREGLDRVAGLGLARMLGHRKLGHAGRHDALVADEPESEVLRARSALEIDTKGEVELGIVE